MDRSKSHFPGSNGFLIGAGVDSFSSSKTLEKVRQGLEGAVGEPILLVKPEVVSPHLGCDPAVGYISQIRSLGVLTGAPVARYPPTDEFVNGIVLPTEKYIQGLHNIKEGSMMFNCMNPKDVGISESDLLDTRTSIYVGTRAIENLVGELNAVYHFKSMNLLGGEVSDEFYSRNRDVIEVGKAEFKKGLKRDIAKGLLNELDEAPMSKKEITKKWEDARLSALMWGVYDESLKFNKMLSVPIGEYIEYIETKL